MSNSFHLMSIFGFLSGNKQPQHKEVSKATIPAKTETRIVQQLRYQKGLTLFEYNTVTKTLQRAVYEKVNANYTNTVTNRKVRLKEGHAYVQSLNVKNAIRKLENEGYEVENVIDS